MSQTMPTHRPIFDNGSSKKQPQPQPAGRSANIATPEMIRKVELSILGLDSTASPFSGYNSVNSHVSSASMSSSRTYENPRENPAMQPFVREIVQFEVNERYKTLLEKNSKLEEQLKQSQKRVEQMEASFSRNLADLQSQTSQLDLSEIASTLSQRDNDQYEEISRQCGGMRGEVDNLQKQVNEEIKQQLAQTAETLQKKDQKIQEYLDAMELKYEQKLALIDQQLKVFSQSKTEGKDGEKLEGVDEMTVKRLEVEQLQVQSEMQRLKSLMEANKVDYVQILNQSVDEKMVNVNKDFSELKQTIAQLREEMGSRIDSLNNSMISENLESSRRNKENDESVKQAKMLEQLSKTVSDLQGKRTAVEDVEKENRELRDRLLKFQRDTSTQMEEMRRLLLSNPQIMMEANRSGFVNNNSNVNQYNQYDEIPTEFRDLKRDDDINVHGNEGYDQEEGEDQDQVEIATFGSRDEPEFVPRKFVGDDSRAFYEKQRTLTERDNFENDSGDNHNSLNDQNQTNLDYNYPLLLPSGDPSQSSLQQQQQQQNNQSYSAFDGGVDNKVTKDDPTVHQEKENSLSSLPTGLPLSNPPLNHTILTNNYINFNQEQRTFSTSSTQPILQQQRTSLPELESKENNKTTVIEDTNKLTYDYAQRTSLFADIIQRQSLHSKTKSEGTIPAEYSSNVNNQGLANFNSKENQFQPQSKDDSNLFEINRESQPFMVTEHSHQTILNHLGFQTTTTDQQATQHVPFTSLADQLTQNYLSKPNQPVIESIQKQDISVTAQKDITTDRITQQAYNQVKDPQQTMMASFGAPQTASLQPQGLTQLVNNVPNPLIDSQTAKEIVENAQKNEQTSTTGSGSALPGNEEMMQTQSEIKFGSILQNLQKLEPEEVVNIHEGDNEQEDSESQPGKIIVKSRSSSSEEEEVEDKNDERVKIRITESEMIKQSTDITQKESNIEGNAGQDAQNIGNLEENKEIGQLESQNKVDLRSNENKIINNDTQPEPTALSSNKASEEEQLKQLAQSSSSEYEKQQQKNQDQDDEEEVIYQLDENGYLMDENNNYILDDNGEMVKLGEEEIKYLRQTNMLDES